MIYKFLLIISIYSIFKSTQTSLKELSFDKGKYKKSRIIHEKLFWKKVSWNLKNDNLEKRKIIVAIREIFNCDNSYYLLSNWCQEVDWTL